MTRLHDTPPEIQEFISLTNAEFDHEFRIDEPLSRTGEWWIDIIDDDPTPIVSLSEDTVCILGDNILFSISYRHGYGFGFYTDEPVFGERPYLICPDVPAALQELKRRLGEPSA